MKENNALGASHGMELPFMLHNVSLQCEMTGDTVKYAAGMVAKMNPAAATLHWTRARQERLLLKQRMRFPR